MRARRAGLGAVYRATYSELRFRWIPPKTVSWLGYQSCWPFLCKSDLSLRFYCLLKGAKVVGTSPGMGMGKVLSVLTAVELRRLSGETQEQLPRGSLLSWLQRIGDNSCWLKCHVGDLGEASKLQGGGLPAETLADQVLSLSEQMLANLGICCSSVNFLLSALGWRSVTMIKSTYWITVILSCCWWLYMEAYTTGYF